jgi:hypothetical protein
MFTEVIMAAGQVWNGGNDERFRSRKRMDARRRYNREYMRRWRADPQNCERERFTRLRAELQRRVRPMFGGRRLFLNRRGRAVCGFCWRGQPIKMVERLRISETEAREYMKVQIPCCAECWVPQCA